MPENHKFIANLSTDWILSKVEIIGKETKTQAQSMLNSRSHPEQGIRSCLGLIRLAEKYGKEAMEQACKLVNGVGLSSYHKINNILRNNQLPTSSQKSDPPIKHDNIRGSDYYNYN